MPRSPGFRILWTCISHPCGGSQQDRNLRSQDPPTPPSFLAECSQASSLGGECLGSGCTRGSPGGGQLSCKPFPRIRVVAVSSYHRVSLLWATPRLLLCGWSSRKFQGDPPPLYDLNFVKYWFQLGELDGRPCYLRCSYRRPWRQLPLGFVYEWLYRPEI